MDLTKNMLGKFSKFVTGTDLATKAVEQGLSLAVNKVNQYRKVEEELERLKRTAVRIDSLLTDAEERRYIEDDRVKLWLHELKSVSFDTDHLLDKYQTLLQVYKLNCSDEANSSRKRKWHEISIPRVRLRPEWNVKELSSFVTEIGKINTRLDDISKTRKTLRLGNKDGKRRESAHHRARPFPAGPLHDQARIFGRESEKNQIVDMLLSDSETSDTRYHVPVVSIFGAAGIGKTTLARLVCDDQRINEYFDLNWVSLTEQCHVPNATKEIFEKMTNQSANVANFDTLQQRLRDHIKTLGNKKFLLVIDNLWAEDFNFWDILSVPLLAGVKGSKVLITTRNEKVCRIMSASSQFNLTGLNENECWKILQSLAGIKDGENDRLEPIGKDIARNCRGSPMAAKTLGFLLNGRDEEEWSDVLSEMRALKEDKNGVLASLKISYHHLPYHVKQCFAYCALFPNGYKFERDQIVRCWIAEGLVHPEGKRRLEAVGNKYFDDLVWRSFFEKLPSMDDCQGERYIMPSLIYDLARLVFDYEFRALECGVSFEKKNIREVRYASLLHRKGSKSANIRCVEDFTSLRTLKLCDECGEQDEPLMPIPPKLFQKLSHMRVLDMSNSSIKSIPDSVGELIHLRYLGLSNTPIKTLPESVCDLFNLQTLALDGCLELDGLPQGMRKLINLRHLDIHLKWEEITDKTILVIPEAVGEIESLQTLSRFNVVSPNKGQSCNINELKDLNLRGDLCILNLENVPTANDAMNANLRGKQFIENLMLRWNSTASDDQQSQKIIESLQPNNRLKSLWIVNYPGTSFPDWLGYSSFSSLEMIKISNCNNFSFLQHLGKLPRLKNLCIDNVKAEILDSFVGFPSLEYLTFSNMPLLEKISLENEIPKLRNISVLGCPNLNLALLHPDIQDMFEF